MKDQEWLESYLEEEEKNNQIRFDRGALARLLREIIKERGLLALGIFLTFGTTLAFLVQPRILAYAIDDVIVPERTDLLIYVALFYFSSELLRTSCAFGSDYFFNFLGQKVMQRLRIRLFGHMQRLPVKVFDETPAGKLVTRVTNDISSLADMFTAGFISILGNLVLIAGTVVSLCLLDWKLALISLSIFPLLILISVYFSRKLKIAYRSSRSKLSALNAFLAENISGMKIVNIFNRQKKHFDRFSKLNFWYSEAQIGSVRVFSLFQPMITFFTGVSVALALYYGGQKTLMGELKIGVLFAFISYILTIFQPLREIADRWNMFLSGMTSAERIFSILDWRPEEGVQKIERPPLRNNKVRGEIEFRNVWFAYQKEHFVLKDFSFKIGSGEMVGIVGPTGSGKSTLLNLLMRYYEPNRGEIFLDGKSLQEWDKRELRAEIGLIQQDVFLFSGSVADNITLWDADDCMSLEEVATAFPEIKPHMEVQLGERGVNLSLGERQLISFARAASKRPSIWILDEATSNMDSDSESKMVSNLARSAKAQTSLVVAHRLSTVRNADQVIVLHQGELRESGTHAQLIRKNGIYAKLYRYQANVEEVGEMG